MQVKDSLTLDASGLSRTSDGYLVGQARVARAGNVQQYLGSEIGLIGDDAAKVFGVYRDPDVVFDEASMQSLAGRPVTRGHPPKGVSAETWSDLAKGAIGGRIVRDGEHVVASMAIMDAAAAAEVEAGARGLSAGYTVGIVRDEGVSPDGVPYQFRQAGSLRFNHVAYLPDNNPRAGNTRIGDSARDWGTAPQPEADMKGKPMADALQNVVFGDKAVPVAATHVADVEKYKSDMLKRLSDAETAHAEVIAGKDRELAAKDAEIDALKAKVLTGDALDARVAARAKVLADAAKVAKVETAGLSDDAIRKAVVVAKLGDDFAEMSQAYHDGRFVELVKAADAEAGKDPMREALKDAAPKATTLDALYTERNAELESAWKMEGK